MPYSLYLFMYNKVVLKSQSAFDRNNRVLNQQDIMALLECPDKRKTLNIFRSAGVDHAPVDGVPYYLNYPLNYHFYHWEHKKAAIADGIISHGLVCTDADVPEALLVLNELTGIQTNSGYVQVLAWNSLGELAKLYPELIDENRRRLLNAFTGSVSSLLGTLIFLERIISTPARGKALEVLKENKAVVRYRAQKALLNYFTQQHSEYVDLMNSCKDVDKNILKFLHQYKTPGRFKVSHFQEGCRTLGLTMEGRNSEIWKGTSQEIISKLISKSCRKYVQAIGAFVKEYM